MHLFSILECPNEDVVIDNITANFTKVSSPFFNNISHELAVDYSLNSGSDGEECIRQCHQRGCSFMVYQYLPTVRQSHRRIRHAPSVCKLYLFDPIDMKPHLKTAEDRGDENVREVMCQNNGI